ncbi:MAG: hypothetical protein WBD31_06075 [Rubripirellula sp.]
MTTFTIESVHGVKQTLSFENFTVGPQPQPKKTQRPMAQSTSNQPAANMATMQSATTSTEPRR